MRFLVILTGLLTCACGHSQEFVKTFYLGDTSIDLIVHRSDQPGPLYYNMHDDEQTSVDAAREIVSEYGGVLYELVHSGMRNIEFYIDSARYEIDPNRIYSDTGIWRELRRVAKLDSFLMVTALRTQDSLQLSLIRDSLMLTGDSVLYEQLQQVRRQNSVLIKNGRFEMTLPLPSLRFNERDSMVFETVKAFADSLLTIMKIDGQTLIVALHNNTNNGYGLESYLLDNIYQNEAIATYRGLHPDPDDFYFVTERWIYEALQPNNYHIVLQDNYNVTDDGSLSVYCGQRGIHYVNVEAQHRHEKEQKEMLQLLLERIFRK